ncbi:PAB-dependent poly(A)-specific ribonuclease subunit 3 [Exophiala xenobiotica]|nr:PAB-dependent poly(A)-specific ribonuclease subunit 3 [Exophiala xenobiotica]
MSGSSNATPLRQDASTPDWAVANVQEFVPRGADDQHLTNENEIPDAHTFQPFQPSHPPNPYLDHSINGTAFYPSGAGFQQPVQYHQYAPIGPFNANLAPYQRTVHDLFIPNDLREEIQKKSAATLQTLPTVRAGQAWKNLDSPNVVRIVDVFTNRGFGDSSLFFATEYHPLSKTLLEHHHIGPNWTRPTRNTKDQVMEPILWTYVVQVAAALKTIHGSGLAARILDPSKVLVTGKNRIRLSGCGILDVVQFDSGVAPLAQLQRQDLVNFALLILSIGSGTADAGANFARSMDMFKRFYKPELQTAVVWLYAAVQNQEKTIDQFVTMISNQMVTAFNAALHNDDALYSELSREVENARLVRLMAKLNFINERPEFEHDRAWSENGERYFLKLFRDYVFHQVDGQNRPVIDLGHVLTCLNKVDAGSEEKVTLISRDEQSCFVVTYRELKKGIESAFQELMKRGQPMR